MQRSPIYGNALVNVWELPHPQPPGEAMTELFLLLLVFILQLLDGVAAAEGRQNSQPAINGGLRLWLGQAGLGQGQRGKHKKETKDK